MAVNIKGPVTRLYADTEGCYIRVPGAPASKHNYYQLLRSHANYNSLYSLALSAAVNGTEITVRTADDITSNEIAEVLYLVVDYPAE